MAAPARTTSLHVRGVRVGMAADPSVPTGVTVLRFESAAPTVIDVRGGASATYDTASLSLDATFGGRWAIFLSGGSVYGLDTARGVREVIIEAGGGHRAFRHPRPVAPVSGACLFDLPFTERPLPDYAQLGRAATQGATGSVAIGRVGAGAGAYVGKYLGRDHASPGGQGFAEGSVRGVGRVGVLAVVNSVGAILDPSDGRWVEGARRRGKLVPPSIGSRPRVPVAATPRGTNLVAVVTDAGVDRPTLQRIAALAHTGLVRCVVPAHTATDGDVAFVTSTGSPPAPRARYPGEVADTLGRLAGDLVVRAVLAAVRR